MFEYILNKIILKACVIALIGMVVAAPQSIQQPRQVAPGPANFQSDQRPVGANEEAKDLQGAGSIGYGYYGGYPYSGYSSAYYGSYPHFGYGGKYFTIFTHSKHYLIL